MNPRAKALGMMLLALLFSASSTAPAPVADAAMRDDVEAVRRLIGEGADVNAAQGDGMTALHWAAAHGDEPLAKLLLDARAKTNATTRIGAQTPLHIASRNGSEAVVTALLGAGADPGATTANGVTPLHFAAMSGSTAVIAALLGRGVEVDVREPAWGQTPLMLAATYDRADAVRVLIRRGADPSRTAKVVDLMELAGRDRAARAKRNAVLDAFRAKSESPQLFRPTPDQVRTAVMAANAAEAQTASATVVEEPEEPAGGGGGDEDFAGFTEMVGTQGGLTALLLASRDGYIDVVQALLESGADVNQPSPGDATSPLLMATINGNYDLAMMLLGSGADVKHASNAGATALYAVINKEWAPSSRTPQPTFNLQQKTTYLELMEALIAAGADPNARLARSLWYTTYNRDNLRVDFAGATPFWRAAYATDVQAMRLLLAHGADPGIPTLRPAPRQRRGAPASPREDPSGLPPVPEGGPGIFPIHAASGVGYGQGFAANDHRHVPDGWLPAVRLLVEELGADVNARDFNGYTPLHNAAARGDNAMIEYLVSKGADVTVVARTGQTTADMANGPVQRISPYLDTVALLEKLGAKNNHRCLAC